MIPYLSSTDRFVTAEQVWASLSADRRAHALRLLAQLAWTYAAAHTEPPSQEVSHVSAPVSNQDPSRTS
jgi:hypothetical protein